MSLQMYMRIEGVTGGSTSFKHQGWFEVLSWNWGMSSNRKLAHGTDQDKTTLNEISIIKPLGIESGEIRTLFAEGRVIPVIELSIQPIQGKREAARKYVDITLQNSIVKTVVTGGNNEDKFFKEHVTFLFENVLFEFEKKADVEGEESNAHEFNWNVPENHS